MLCQPTDSDVECLVLSVEAMLDQEKRTVPGLEMKALENCSK